MKKLFTLVFAALLMANALSIGIRFENQTDGDIQITFKQLLNKPQPVDEMPSTRKLDIKAGETNQLFLTNPAPWASWQATDSSGKVISEGKIQLRASHRQHDIIIRRETATPATEEHPAAE